MISNAAKRQPRDRNFNTLARRWGEFALEDAIKDLSLFLRRKDDIDLAKMQSPGECVLAQCTIRVIGSARAAFFRNTAYIELPDQKGRRVVRRYKYHPLTKAYVKDFDDGKEVAANVEMLLLAPRPGNTLEQMRVRKRQRLSNPAVRQRENAAQAKREKAKRQKAKNRQPNELPFMDPLFIERGQRSGTGRIQKTASGARHAG